MFKNSVFIPFDQAYHYEIENGEEKLENVDVIFKSGSVNFKNALHLICRKYHYNYKNYDSVDMRSADSYRRAEILYLKNEENGKAVPVKGHTTRVNGYVSKDPNIMMKITVEGKSFLFNRMMNQRFSECYYLEDKMVKIDHQGVTYNLCPISGIFVMEVLYENYKENIEKDLKKQSESVKVAKQNEIYKKALLSHPDNVNRVYHCQGNEKRYNHQVFPLNVDKWSYVRKNNFEYISIHDGSNIFLFQRNNDLFYYLDFCAYDYLKEKIGNGMSNVLEFLSPCASKSTMPLNNYGNRIDAKGTHIDSSFVKDSYTRSILKVFNVCYLKKKKNFPCFGSPFRKSEIPIRGFIKACAREFKINLPPGTEIITHGYCKNNTKLRLCHYKLLQYCQYYYKTKYYEHCSGKIKKYPQYDKRIQKVIDNMAEIPKVKTYFYREPKGLIKGLGGDALFEMCKSRMVFFKERSITRPAAAYVDDLLNIFLNSKPMVRWVALGTDIELRSENITQEFFEQKKIPRSKSKVYYNVNGVRKFAYLGEMLSRKKRIEIRNNIFRAERIKAYYLTRVDDTRKRLEEIFYKKLPKKFDHSTYNAIHRFQNKKEADEFESSVERTIGFSRTLKLWSWRKYAFPEPEPEPEEPGEDPENVYMPNIHGEILTGDY